jgi:hypothetical protein
VTDKQATNDPPISTFDLAPGLLDYYSSQAELMLAQYENINRLLGPTTRGTPSGDLCESLLRGFLRRFLPSTLSVDKGYFYGRSVLDGKDTHCPEIDILVHDTHSFLPLSRTEDFVIVRPQAVRAMIQVKRTFTVGQVEDGLKNVIQAKQQLVHVLWIEQKKAMPGWAGSPMPPRIFTGVVGFEGQVGKNLEFYRKTLLDWHTKHRACDRAKMIETSMYVLPGFIGSLKTFFLFLDGPGNFINQRYLAFDSEHSMERITPKRAKKSRKPQRVRKNICIQALLAKMYNVIGGEVSEMPPFAFPPGLRHFDAFSVLHFDLDLNLEQGTAALRRNDGWNAQYRRDDGPVKDKFHVLCDPKGAVAQTELLHTDLTPQELFVKRERPDGAVAERYVRVKS